MRVVFFQIVPFYGGSYRSLVELAGRLDAEDDMDVEIVDVFGNCEEFTAAVERSGVRSHVLLPGRDMAGVGSRANPVRRMVRMVGRLPDLVRINKAAARLMEEREPSAIVSSDFRSLAALSWGKMKRWPKIAYMRGWWTPDQFTLTGRMVVRHRCEGVIAVSHPTRTALMCGGVDRDKIHVVHNPIEVDDMTVQSQRPLAAEVPQDDRAVKLLLPANLYATKGHETAIRATSLLVERGMDVVLWMAGAIKAAHERYHKEMCEVARQVGVEANIEWLGLRNDIPQLMVRSTAVVLPTYREGHPRVSLEAMALGIPFISTPAGGVLDMVLPGVTGWLHDIGDAEGLAECVQEVVSNPERAKVVAETGRDYVRDQFRPEHQLQALRKAFQSVVGTSRR